MKMLRVAVVAVAATLVTSGAQTPVAAGALRQQSTLPTVNMELAVKAAQWDPVKSGTGITPGAGPSVTLVEEALRAKGLLAASYVDGHFGSATVSAYAAWQRSLGYSGLGANGLPGISSLTKLSTNNFTVRRQIGPGSRITFRGFPLNVRTRDMLLAAEARSGRTFVVTQGSYSPGTDPTSAGTHDGGGAVDIDVVDLTTAQRYAAAKALREVGFAAWVRSPSQGDWPWHIHAIAISDTDLAPAAQKQVGKYYEGRNGLANNGPDDGPPVVRVTWEEFMRTQ